MTAKEEGESEDAEEDPRVKARALAQPRVRSSALQARLDKLVEDRLRRGREHETRKEREVKTNQGIVQVKIGLLVARTVSLHSIKTRVSLLESGRVLSYL